MEFLVINGDEVRRLFSMPEWITSMREAMIDASAGNVNIPPRMVTAFQEPESSLVLMPGNAPGARTRGVKLLTLGHENPQKGLPAVQGFIALFGYDTGEPVALIEGSSITAMRTAAASGLATDILSRADARRCGILGAGVQARSHIAAMASVRPIEEFVIWARDATKATVLADSVRTEYDARFSVVEDPVEAGECDIVCTVTSSPTPVLHSAWVKPGAHINLVGAYQPDTREADTALMARASIFVDLMQSARDEAGDILIAIQDGAITWNDVNGEIGDILSENIPGRTLPDEITIYKSIGNIAQDLFAAKHLYEKALTNGGGIKLDF